jgi:hypothetical protein
MVSWPETHDYDLDDEPWNRRKGEPTRGYSAFRIYRDLPGHQRLLTTVAEQVSVTDRQVRRWAAEWAWRDRTDAWDDACHRIEDHERLEAIRSMHALHRRVGRAAITKAAQALANLDPITLPPSVIARLLELGARLERSTLIVSVEELQGVDQVEDGEDPWERIAAELDPHVEP